jgi:hypothetical protein
MIGSDREEENVSEIKLTYTGGPAFPVDLGTLKGGSFGLTKREWFAGMALQGDWASQSKEVGEYASDTSDSFLEERAKLFYRMADAMIRAGKGEK